MSGHKVSRSVTFNSVKHKRLLALTDAEDNLSKVIRAALRQYYDLESGVTLGMVYRRLGEIDRKLENGVAVSGGSDVPGDVDGDTLGDDILGAFG